MSTLNRILITGGNGMLAHAFRHVLAARGYGATVVARDACDVTSAGEVARTFDAARPTLVLNCAAYTKVDLAEKEPDKADAVNGRCPGVLASLCRERGAALVHFSTDYVFDGSLRRPLRPDDPVGPASAYGRSKLLGERNLRDNAPENWLILRTAWLYGPGGPNFVQTMVNAARAGKPLKVVADQVGSPTYTFDLAAATLDLIDRGAAGVWHLSNAGQTTWFDFARAIFEEWGLSPSLEPLGSADWQKMKPDSAIRPAYSVLDVEPFARLTGRPMRPWRDALRDYRQRVEPAPAR